MARQQHINARAHAATLETRLQNLQADQKKHPQHSHLSKHQAARHSELGPAIVHHHAGQAQSIECAGLNNHEHGMENQAAATYSMTGTDSCVGAICGAPVLTGSDTEGPKHNHELAVQIHNPHLEQHVAKV